MATSAPHAEKPGKLVCIDTFYIGNLQGVGKMWQLTACDAASSYGMAKVVSANNAKEAARLLWVPETIGL